LTQKSTISLKANFHKVGKIALPFLDPEKIAREAVGKDHGRMGV
jgi:hypothetical protein